LYERRTVVENLIQSIEDYQRAHNAKTAPAVEFSGARKCS
jgi:hypothetical protein